MADGPRDGLQPEALAQGGNPQVPQINRRMVGHHMEGNQLLHASIRLQGKIDDGIIRGQPPSFIPRPAAADPLLPLETVHNPADGLIRIFNLEQGLHNIIDGPQPQSLLHIFKLVVAGQDDRMNVGMKLPQVTDQLKA